MPLWLTILCSTGIAGLLIKEIWCGIKAGTKKAQAEAKRKKQAEMREVIKEEIDPLKEDVARIEENTKESLEADVLALRCNMKAIMERVKKQGYSDIGDKSTMKQLRTKYEKLGGNEFKNFVDHWCDIVANLPDEKVKKSAKK